MNVRKLLIAAPWVTASGAALYAASQWSRLPARMALHLGAMGRPNGWQAKGMALSVQLLLMFGMLALFTVLLSMPWKIRTSDRALSDPVEDRRLALQIILLIHNLIGGVLLPLSLIHIVNRNL
jgi:uncharacterized membrane protein